MGEIGIDKTEIFYPLLGKITFISTVSIAEKGMMGDGYVAENTFWDPWLRFYFVNKQLLYARF